MKEEVLETLAEMGCYRIWIGAESGSQRILDAMQRGVKVEQVEWATKAAQRHGIQVGMFLMWGYDGEELQDIETTIEQLKRWNPDLFLTTVAYPIKNTPYFEQVADRAVLNKPWSSGTDRDFAIHGRHSRRYYQHADNWLRSEVAAFRLDANDPPAAAAQRAQGQAAREALMASAHEREA
jgi:anaerobic magnesium-protoporphyrin IX monomethyl ester cyclase